jgi:probable selenium-dependent hydroxylase accessory protein YqeC
VDERVEPVIPPLRKQFGLGDHELVSIVGAGGKSTIIFMLGTEMADSGKRVILTTTTMMAADQATEPTCWSDDPGTVDAALRPGTPLMVVTGTAPGKITGPSPESVDRLFVRTGADHVIVEADGARSMSIKAPAVHEPAIPQSSTVVIVVASAHAINRPVREIAHRPELVSKITGLGLDDPMTIDAAARLLLHPEGGLKSIPERARVVAAITQVIPTNERVSAELAAIVGRHPRIDRAALLPKISSYPAGTATA